MPGIFIKDMSLPDNCARCPLALLDSYGYRTCFVMELDVTECNGWTYDRHSDCPMREVEEVKDEN